METIFVRLKDMPAAIKKRYGYDVSLHTLKHWRRRHPLPTPARLEELSTWFEARIKEKREDQMVVKRCRSVPNGG